MKYALFACLAAALTLAPQAGLAQDGQYVMDYWGFTDQQPTTMNGLGFVDDIAPPFIWDPVTFQYTWLMDSVTLDSMYTDEFGCEHYFYSGGVYEVYEDISWNAIYDDSGENCSISDPSTFTDGELYLLGNMLSLTLEYFPAYLMGSYQGTLDLVGGSHLEDIPELLRNGWTFGGVTGEQRICIPDGYDYRADGQLFLYEDPTATEESTWGGVKSLFR
ncbi:MAG: hypothetical protein KAW17_01900 [Candidatus Eisenbacteria sp.]|nr:hypothetical protein [Candidatus Eisenbacteria bacterium]